MSHLTAYGRRRYACPCQRLILINWTVTTAVEVGLGCAGCRAVAA